MEGVIAAILAGGKGKRFRPYTEIIPKPMMPLGPREKPILEHIIAWIARSGVRDYVLLVGYRWRQIQNYFRDGSTWGVRIAYSIDDEEYSDTGGALLKAYRAGLFNGYSDVLVWYGDIVAPLDVKQLIEAHRGSKAHATLVLADRYQLPVGVAMIDDEGNIVELREKPWLEIKVTIGVLVVTAKAIGEAGDVLGKKFDIMGDMIPWMIRQGYRVKAYIYSGHWYDVGSLERYQKFDEKLFKEFLS